MTAGSDRPVPPRSYAARASVDLATISTGEWDEVDITGVLPPGFDEPLVLRSVSLAGASMVGARLRGSRWVDVSLVGCDLAGADLESSAFTRVELRDCRLSGAQLAQGRWRDVHLVDVRLDGANLRQLRGERTCFDRCRLDHAELIDASFEGVAWWDCDLTGADVSHISVARAQLHGSTIDGLRGASSLAPVSIDTAQQPAFAAHVLATLGIVVSERDDR